MKSFITPVTHNGTSVKITLLHKALKALGFPVSEEEEKSQRAM